MHTTLVNAWVGNDTTGIRVISAHNPFLTVPLPTGEERRMYAGYVAAEATDHQRIRMIIAVSAGCTADDVQLLSCTPIN